MNCQQCGHNIKLHKVFYDRLASCVHDPGDGFTLCGCSWTPIEIECDAWKLALQSLTPGGSEFTEPEACVSFARERKKHPQRFVRLEAELAKRQWIPVSERGPDKSGFIMIYTPQYSEPVHIIWYRTDEPTPWKFAHWMPLPEPPQS